MLSCDHKSYIIHWSLTENLLCSHFISVRSGSHSVSLEVLTMLLWNHADCLNKQSKNRQGSHDHRRHGQLACGSSESSNPSCRCTCCRNNASGCRLQRVYGDPVNISGLRFCNSNQDVDQRAKWVVAERRWRRNKMYVHSDICISRRCWRSSKMRETSLTPISISLKLATNRPLWSVNALTRAALAKRTAGHF